MIRQTLKTVIDNAYMKLNYPEVQIISSRHPQRPYYSQHGQDRFIHEFLGEEVSLGTFLDIGCNHPEVGNNSKFFEDIGWTGFAFDPQKKFSSVWREKRKTPFINAAINIEKVEKKFVEFKSDKGWEHQISGFKEYVKPRHLKKYKYEEYSVESAPMSHFVGEFGNLDLVMIDVEGAEMVILKTLFADNFFPKYILFENNRSIGGNRVVRDFLLKKGYRFQARIANVDDFFVRKQPQ